MRQYMVVHIPTGEATLVNYRADASYEAVSRAVGYYYPADCEVNVIEVGYERPLPFDTLPLVIRSAREAMRRAA